MNLSSGASQGLTIAGKIQVFKSLMFPKLVYKATMNAVPKTKTDQLRIIHTDFTRNQTHCPDWRVCRRGLTGPKISWIGRLFDTNFHPRKTLAKTLLHKMGDLYIFHFDPKLSEQSLCVGGYHDLCGGYHQCIGGVQSIGRMSSVHLGDIISSLREF